MNKISIIVPIYNAADLVPRCLESILVQTFQDFELIIVDDGSDKDNSLQVCKEYAEKDKRIRVFHKENGGQTSARRYGFENSNGDWIYFVDADDFLPKDALSFLYEKAIKNKLDLVDGASISYYEDFTVKENVLFSQLGEFEILDYLKLMFKNQANNGTHACLFKRTLFNQETFNIPENVRLGEDAYIHLCLATQAKRAGIYNDIVYYYVQNRNSITHYYKYTSIRPLESQIESIRRILIKNGIFETFKKVFYARAITSLATACLNNHRLITDKYNSNIANEALPNINSLYIKLLSYFLKYPILYPFYYLTNKNRKILNSIRRKIKI